MHSWWLQHLAPCAPPAHCPTGTLPSSPQTAWELVQSGVLLGGGPEAGVYVGIQQMEYGGLSAPHLLAIGPFSGEAA